MRDANIDAAKTIRTVLLAVLIPTLSIAFIVIVLLLIKLCQVRKVAVELRLQQEPTLRIETQHNSRSETQIGMKN